MIWGQKIQQSNIHFRCIRVLFVYLAYLLQRPIIVQCAVVDVDHLAFGAPVLRVRVPPDQLSLICRRFFLHHGVTVIRILGIQPLRQPVGDRHPLVQHVAVPMNFVRSSVVGIVEEDVVVERLHVVAVGTIL